MAKVEGEAASYALEGSVAVAGLALRSKLISSFTLPGNSFCELDVEPISPQVA